ncbi:DUF4177 domain-containing protein [Ruegeria sediminis]|uniref:DUF4177 domain-containing protein n=1 Tax=Ruegeria sediminis TaxID=2583820 RepID=A0ABY2X043_9RHOB|nr:DUF4177 domain-containing protein [Ruegeria sediminis]TMV07940.1 DUF4177 domain-containing protein [Ruegeria sediminis]
MTRYEYKVVPAPQKGTKAKGVKTVEGRFALSIEQALNQMGAEGWEYLRAELLPSEERSGLTGSTVNWRNVLVFRRALEDEAEVPVVEFPAQAASAIPLARPVRGPDSVKAPARISEAANDPPMSLKPKKEAGAADEDGDAPEKT